jgi:two-component system response regulator PilR (NtrC family)
MQVKLLRAIQEKRVRQVGATAEEAVDVRLICATHQEPEAFGGARALPPGSVLPPERDRAPDAALRECREDIPALARHILNRLSQSAGRPPPPLAVEALAALQDYRSPAMCANWRTSWSGLWP